MFRLLPEVSSDLRPRKQCIEARNWTIKLLGFITRSIKSISAEVILESYYRMDIILL